MTELERIANEAAAHGMSYGKYIAWKYESELKQKQFVRETKLKKNKKKTCSKAG